MRSVFQHFELIFHWLIQLWAVFVFCFFITLNQYDNKLHCHIANAKKPVTAGAAIVHCTENVISLWKKGPTSQPEDYWGTKVVEQTWIFQELQNICSVVIVVAVYLFNFRVSTKPLALVIVYATSIKRLCSYCHHHYTSQQPDWRWHHFLKTRVNHESLVLDIINSRTDSCKWNFMESPQNNPLNLNQ